MILNSSVTPQLSKRVNTMYLSWHCRTRLSSACILLPMGLNVFFRQNDSALDGCTISNISFFDSISSLIIYLSVCQSRVCHAQKQPYGPLSSSHDHAVRPIDVNSCILFWWILLRTVDVSSSLFYQPQTLPNLTLRS